MEEAERIKELEAKVDTLSEVIRGLTREIEKLRNSNTPNVPYTPPTPYRPYEPYWDKYAPYQPWITYKMDCDSDDTDLVFTINTE